MTTIAVSETIRAPQAKVFALASDIPGAAGRVKGINKVEVLRPAEEFPDNFGPVGRGFTWRETRTMMGRQATEDMTITDWSPPHAYTVEARSHGCHYRSLITAVPVDPGTTRLTMAFEATPETTMARVMMKLFRFMNKQVAKCLGDDLKDIKAACEAAG
jgi:hypothetical protein